MRAPSARLLALLRGERVAKPPFFEPWFGMMQMLAEDFGNDPIRMCSELEIGATPLPDLAGTNTSPPDYIPRVDYCAMADTIRDYGLHDKS